jgi:hypothetical protein
MAFSLQQQANPAELYSITAMNYTYTATDPNYLTLNDVSGVTLNGGISLNNSGTSSANATVSVTGQIVSQQFGTIPVNINGFLQADDSSGALNGTVQYVFQFSGFLATFEQDYKEGAITNLLNGNSITQAAFDAYFQSGGDPFYYISGLNRISGD